MPQEFHVLQCYKCNTFQVQQVKKVLKWTCKLCGEKQSVQRVFGRGSGAECRKHVQTLNTIRGETEATRDQIISGKSYENQDVHLHNFQIDEAEVQHDIGQGQEKQDGNQSKWSKYVQLEHDDDPYGDDDDNSVMYTTDRSLYNASNKNYRTIKREKSKQTSNNRNYQSSSKFVQNNLKWPSEESTKQTSDYKHPQSYSKFVQNNSKWPSDENTFEHDPKPSYRQTLTSTCIKLSNDKNTCEQNLKTICERTQAIKRLPENCVSSKPVKRSKWDDYVEEDIEQTEEFEDLDHEIYLFE